MGEVNARRVEVESPPLKINEELRKALEEVQAEKDLDLCLFWKVVDSDLDIFDTLPQSLQSFEP